MCHIKNLNFILLFLQNQLSGNLLRKFKNSNGWQKLWVVFTNFSLFFYKSHQVIVHWRHLTLNPVLVCSSFTPLCRMLNLSVKLEVTHFPRRFLFPRPVWNYWMTTKIFKSPIGHKTEHLLVLNQLRPQLGQLNDQLNRINKWLDKSIEKIKH